MAVTDAIVLPALSIRHNMCMLASKMKRKNPAAKALGALGGAKRKFHPRKSELARAACLAMHIRQGHNVQKVSTNGNSLSNNGLSAEHKQLIAVNAT